MWAIHLLANNPECQQKLQEELDLIFSDDSCRDVTVADISEMKYLECCVKETLRLYPSVPFIMRQIESDIELGKGKIIPKGATAFISIYYTHRHPDYYDDPNAFKPERFSLENTVKRHPYSYIPFSAGKYLTNFIFILNHKLTYQKNRNLCDRSPKLHWPKICTDGMLLILNLLDFFVSIVHAYNNVFRSKQLLNFCVNKQEAKVVLAKLLRTYWIEPVDKLETLSKLPHVVLRCDDGVRVKLRKRKAV